MLVIDGGCGGWKGRVGVPLCLRCLLGEGAHLLFWCDGDDRSVFHGGRGGVILKPLTRTSRGLRPVSRLFLPMSPKLRPVLTSTPSRPPGADPRLGQGAVGWGGRGRVGGRFVLPDRPFTMGTRVFHTYPGGGVPLKLDPRGMGGGDQSAPTQIPPPLPPRTAPPPPSITSLC